MNSEIKGNTHAGSTPNSWLKKMIWSLSLFLLLLFLVLGLNFHRDIPLKTLKEKYTYSNSEFIEVDGMQVHFRKSGNGFPLVLIHGTGASLHTWEKWTQLLEKDFKVISLDMPAFGLTGAHPERDYSIPAYVEFLNNFVAAIGIDSFYLAGNSLGGFISWEFALAYPYKVKKLVLVDASGFPRKEPLPLGIRMAKYPISGELLLKVTPKSLFRKSLRDVYGDRSKVTKGLVDQYFEIFLRPGNRQAFVDRARHPFSGNPSDLSLLTIPTLILWGEEDAWLDVKYGTRFDKILPDSRLITYPGIGHVPMEEIPERTAEDTRAFLLHPEK